MPTSQFQRDCAEILAKWVGYRNIEENIRPDWMTSEDGARLELDLWVPFKRVAFEIQGEQHYRFTPVFHKDYEDFERQRDRDNQKHWLCECKDVRLFVINSVEEMRWTVSGLISEERKLSASNRKRPQMKQKLKNQITAITEELEAGCTAGRRQYLESYLRGIHNKHQKRLKRRGF